MTNFPGSSPRSKRNSAGPLSGTPTSISPGAITAQAGELKHLDLKDSDFRYDDWIEALRDFDVQGLVICESPNREIDALMLKKLFWARSEKTGPVE